MKFPTPNYHGIATAPGVIVVATDFWHIRTFPVLRNEDPDSPVNRPYYENAERILLQSVAAATMSAHLAAAALGYNVWWVTAIGQQDAQKAIKPLLDVSEEISIIDIMCFGPPAKPIYKRWKKGAQPDHELGPIRSLPAPDRRAGRGLDQDPAPSRDVPLRGERRLTSQQERHE